MELLCPHCLKKVTVSDDKSGQVLNCPLCQGVFAAPALPPAPMRTAPPPSPPPMSSVPTPFPVQPLETQPPPLTTSVSAGQPMPKPVPPPPPPKPPADYSRKFAFQIRPDILACTIPACLFLVLVVSFFGWHAVLDQPEGLSMWALGFGQRGSGLFLAYDLLIILTFLVSVACTILELRLVPTPPQLAILMPWKTGITFVLLLLTFVLFAYDYQQGLFASIDLIALAEKIAFRLHLLALVAAGLELWVQSRIARNLPLPRITLKL